MRQILIAVALLLVCSSLNAQQSLDNDGVIKLVKAGLSEDLIISTVNASPGTYDTSATGLVALKTGGASDKVIDAVLKKSSVVPAQPSVAKAPEVSAPAAETSSGRSGAPRIFIKADADFAVALTAAMNKKHDPAVIVLDEKSAEYVLQSASVAAKQESGASKVARCLFAYCAGIEGTSSVSVQLVRVSDASVVWAYQVRKANGGPSGIQSLSEAVAKHLRNEFLNKR